ncbi:hypothetical protein Droror1_Dr00015742 [Drosera rotundifolia]
MGGVFLVEGSGMIQTRVMTGFQPMTALGKMEAKVQSGCTTLAGLNRKYLTPEATVNTDFLADELKRSTGLATAVWSAHVGKMRRWKWEDNHTTLLVNMIRYALIKKTECEVGHLPNQLGPYKDGHVTVDLDQWWPQDYPSSSSFDSWPGGDLDENYPYFDRLIEPVPSVEADVLDLRSLTEEQCRFVLLMTGRWDRSSRFRLYFSTARLIDKLMYLSS